MSVSVVLPNNQSITTTTTKWEAAEREGKSKRMSLKLRDTVGAVKPRGDLGASKLGMQAP